MFNVFCVLQSVVLAEDKTDNDQHFDQSSSCGYHYDIYLLFKFFHSAPSPPHSMDTSGYFPGSEVTGA
jgi:hypothetical protein